ncbi:hypothetical protein BDY19DRAFT_550009 [Irpex rosettiformis]|uniref:Uncharacterized protein n=1 Tax=Irpex rosettiformis TaxID=378272 RepID=A0ACB8TQS7_9APHY|nr:hypothetical protein BDY19DRAFT_550009 [Irpex rosettiformis]
MRIDVRSMIAPGPRDHSLHQLRKCPDREFCGRASKTTFIIEGKLDQTVHTIESDLTCYGTPRTQGSTNIFAFISPTIPFITAQGRYSFKYSIAIGLDKSVVYQSRPDLML